MISALPARPPFKLALRAVATALCCCLYGCGGGGGAQLASGGVGGTGGGGGQGAGGGGGVGGTGVVALGTIARTESSKIVIGSIGFEITPTTAVLVDDNASTPAALRSGMLVLAEGYKDTATQTTQAEKVIYRSNVRGPVESISADCKSATVLGQPVAVRSTTEPPLARGACDLTIGELLDVSGPVSDAERNSIVASFIRRAATPTTLQVIGAIASADEHKLTVGGLTVDFENAQISPASARLVAGATVVVNGQLSGPQLLNAAEIELVEAGIPGAAGQEGHLKGYIDNLSGTSFTVNGQAVNAATAVLNPPGLVFANGQRVEIEGRFDAQGILVASHIEAEVEED